MTLIASSEMISHGQGQKSEPLYEEGRETGEEQRTLCGFPFNLALPGETWISFSKCFPSPYTDGWLHNDFNTWSKEGMKLEILSNYWMRPSRIWRILQIKEGAIHSGRRPRWITPSEICRILHILRKPNSIIALLFIQNISSFLIRHYALCFSAHQI